MEAKESAETVADEEWTEGLKSRSKIVLSIRNEKVVSERTVEHAYENNKNVPQYGREGDIQREVFR